MLHEKLRNYLGITPPADYSKDITDLQAQNEKWKKEFWKHRQLLKDRAETTCPVCKKSLTLWPLETEAYYTRDGEAYHVKCYEQVSNG